jgi:hypothetical protein
VSGFRVSMIGVFINFTFSLLLPFPHFLLKEVVLNKFLSILLGFVFLNFERFLLMFCQKSKLMESSYRLKCALFFLACAVFNGRP